MSNSPDFDYQFYQYLGRRQTLRNNFMNSSSANNVVKLFDPVTTLDSDSSVTSDDKYHFELESQDDNTPNDSYIDTDNESEWSDDSSTTTDLIQSHVEINSEIDSEVDENEVDSEVDESEIDSEVDENEVDSEVDENEVDSEVKSEIEEINPNFLEGNSSTNNNTLNFRIIDLPPLSPLPTLELENTTSSTQTTNDNDTTNNTVANLTQKVAMLTDSLEKVVTERDTLVDKCQGLQTQIIMLDGKLETERSEKTQALKSRDTAVMLRDESVILYDEVVELRDDMMEERDEALDDLEQVTLDLKQQQDKNHNLQKQLATIREQKAMLVEECDTLKLDSDDTAERHTDSIKQLTSNLNEVSRERDDLIEQLNHQIKDCHDTNQKREIVQQQFEQLYDSMRIKSVQLSQAQRENEEWESHYEELETRLSKDTQTIETLQQKNSDMERIHKSEIEGVHESYLHQLQQDKEEKKDIDLKRQTMIESLRKERQSFRSDAENYRLEKESLERLVAKQQKDLGMVRDQLRAARLRIDQGQKSHAKEMVLLKKDLAETLKAKTTAMGDIIRDRDLEIDRLTNNNESYKRELSNTRMEINSYQKLGIQQRNTITTLEDTIDRLEYDIDDTTNTNNTITSTTTSATTNSTTTTTTNDSDTELEDDIPLETSLQSSTLTTLDTPESNKSNTSNTSNTPETKKSGWFW